MGRPPGSRNKPKDEAEVHIGSIGDNSKVKELTPEQKRSLLMQACEHITPLKDEIATVIGEIRQIYKQFKADGIPKKDIDFALSLQKMETSEVVALHERNMQIIEWIHPGVQAELSFEDGFTRVAG